MKIKSSVVALTLLATSASAAQITWGSADLKGQISGVQAGWVVALYKDVNLDGWGASSINFADGSTDSDEVLTGVTTALSSGKTGTIWGDIFFSPGDVGLGDNLVSVVFNSSSIAAASEYWYTSAFETITGTTGPGGSYQTPGTDILDTYTTTEVVPEPATAMLFGIGGMGAWMLRRKNQRAKKDEELEG